MKMVNFEVSENNSYSLNNQENYYAAIDYTNEQITEKYSLLINEYLKVIMGSISIKKIDYFKFVLMRGINTITTVFTYILLYSRNLHMAYYYSQKAFYYYIEFISQISEDQHSFLQLTSKDATMYVYKKTIFDIKDEMKTPDILLKSDRNKIAYLNQYIKIYRNILHHVIEQLKDMNDYTIYTERFQNAVGSLSIKNDNIYFLFTDLETKDIGVLKYLDILSKINAKSASIKSCILKKKMLSVDYDLQISKEPDAFVKWLLTP